MEASERIRYLRKQILKKTQQEFADTIKISRSNLGNIETGEVAVTDRVLCSICEKFNVNENWLRFGSGDPLKKKTRNQEILEFANDVMELPDENLKKRLIEGLAKLDVSDWEKILEIAEKLLPRSKSKEGS